MRLLPKVHFNSEAGAYVGKPWSLQEDILMSPPHLKVETEIVIFHWKCFFVAIVATDSAVFVATLPVSQNF